MASSVFLSLAPGQSLSLGAGVTLTLNATYEQLASMTAPDAPGAGNVRLYADTSGGKIRLMARFPSGVAQQVAAEP